MTINRDVANKSRPNITKGDHVYPLITNDMRIAQRGTSSTGEITLITVDMFRHNFANTGEDLHQLKHRCYIFKHSLKLDCTTQIQKCFR